MRMTHSFTDDSATIRIEGLAGPVRMLHLTDTHMQFYDERDGENYEACVDYCQRYAKMNEEQGTNYVPGDTFRQAMAQAATRTGEVATMVPVLSLMTTRALVSGWSVTCCSCAIKSIVAP